MHNKKRLEKQLLFLLSEIISEDIENPDLQEVTSIVEIELNNDSSIAKVYVDFYRNPERLLEELNKASSFIRSALAPKLSMRKVPELNFVLDNKLDKINEIEELLKEG